MPRRRCFGARRLILHLAEVGSTNDWLRSNARQFGDGQWVYADRQTAGRGRMGRAWQMPEGNLAASCLIRPQPGEGNPAELGFVASLALFDAVAAQIDAVAAQIDAVAALIGSDRLQLKWPNDLLMDGAKLSGILLEREAGVLVLGIGVNLAVAPPLPDRPTAALADAGVIVGPAVFAQSLSNAFAARRAIWRTAGFAPVREAWLARAHPIGTRLWATAGDGPREGLFAGLDDNGALLLDGVDGRRHWLHAGDVWDRKPGEAGDRVQDQGES